MNAPAHTVLRPQVQNVPQAEQNAQTVMQGFFRTSAPQHVSPISVPAQTVRQPQVQHASPAVKNVQAVRQAIL
jgi:hypothetical protein